MVKIINLFLITTRYNLKLFILCRWVLRRLPKWGYVHAKIRQKAAAAMLFFFFSKLLIIRGKT